jgi:hypothetical protein
MANGLRGEIDFLVGDKTYILRLSLGDLKALQQQTGVPTLAWSKRLQEHNFGMEEIDAILTHALRSGDKERFRRPSDVAVVLEEAGFPACLDAAVQVLVEALRDPRERKADQNDQGDHPL